MPLDVARLRDSAFAAKASGDEFMAGVLLWCASWHQIPAGSLPDDDAELSALAGFGRVVKEWRKVKTMALHGWVKCSDGRLYHETVAEKVNESWRAKLKQRWLTECARIKKWNERHDRKLAIPDFETWLSLNCPSGQPANVASDKPQVSQGQDGDIGSKGQGQGERQGQGKDKPKAAVPAVVPEKPVQPKLLDEGVPNWVPAKPWAAFVEMRKAFRGAKFTEEAERLVLLELTKLRQAGHDPAEVLNQSIRKGWRDVFPIKSERQPNGASQSPRSFNHAIASAARRRAGGGLLDEGDSGDGRVIDGSCTEVPGSEDRRLGPPDHPGGM